MATAEMRAQPAVGWWVRQGAIGGAIAGVVFAIFEMIMAALLKDAFFGPLRMISGIALGKQALMPDYSLITAVLVGIVIHMLISMILGVVFALLAAYVPALAGTTALLVAAAAVYGLILWLVNFYAIAPLAGWNWFPNMTNPAVQFFAHTLFFGAVLGLYLDRVRQQQPVA